MTWQEAPYAPLQLGNSLLLLLCAAFAWPRRRAPGARYFMVLTLVQAGWSAAQAVEDLTTSGPLKFLLVLCQYPGIAATPFLTLILALELVGLDHHLGRRGRRALLVLPLLVVALAVTNPWHELMYTDTSAVRLQDGLVLWGARRGPAFWAYLVVGYSAMAAAGVVLLGGLLRSPELYRGQILALLLGMLTPWAANAYFVLGPHRLPTDLTPVAFAFSAMVMGWSLVRLGFLDLVPLARTTVVEGLDDGVLTLDPGGRIVDLNPSAARLLGGPAGARIGGPVGPFLERLGLPRELSPARGEAVLDGRELESRLSLLPGGSGLLVVHDATQRRRAERENRVLAHALRSIGDAVVLSGLDRRIGFVNRAFESMYGWSLAEVQGRDASLLRLPEARERLAQAVDAATEAEGFRGELENVRKDGTRFPIALTTAPVRDDPGRVLGYVGVARDISARRAAEQELQEARDEAEAARVRAQAASRGRSEFLASMSHELRTPLNAVIGYSEMLQEMAEERGRDVYAGDLTRIQAAGRHLLELVDEVLDLSKVEAGRMELDLAELDVREVLDEVAAVARPLVEKNGNRFRVEVAGEVRAVRADATKLRQVLLNLLSNAAKFTRSGSVDLEVGEAGGVVAFAVRDSGLGMTAEQLARLFEPYVQAEETTQRRFGGTGLGLALSRRLARLMGGEIGASSVHGQGSTFELTLPAASG